MGFSLHLFFKAHFLLNMKFSTSQDFSVTDVNTNLEAKLKKPRSCAKIVEWVKNSFLSFPEAQLFGPFLNA